MSVTLAKSAGFCFGVSRAVKSVYDLLNNGKKVCTLGPIIHNPQLVGEFSEKGVKIINDISEYQDGYTLVIRSHGIGRDDYQKIEQMGIEFVDATCPFVKKIHETVESFEGDEYVILIAGDKNHPEVIGITKHCLSPYFVFKDEDELENLLKKNNNFCEKRPVICAQTTFNIKIWQNCLKTLKKLYTNELLFDTICNATVRRQNEAIELSKQSDVMIVIGGHESSNTSKLKSVCSLFAKTYLVETADELPNDIKSGSKIGITAGASTPASIIKEVLVTMSNIEKEMNFEELLEESLKDFNTDEKVRGVVVGISPNEVYVDVGRKQAGFIPVAELSNDPNARTDELVKIGDEFELLIMKTNDQEGTIMLSKKRIDAQKGWEDLAKALEEEAVLTGKVTEVVKGGLVILFNGIRVFVPASQATVSRGEDLETLKGTEQEFRIIEVNRQKRRSVGSIRSVLKDKRKEEQDKFWESIEEGQEFTGKVKSLTNFGAFIDLGAVDGMVHVSELSWNRIKHPRDVISEGDELTVYVKSLDKEKNRISLGYKKDEDNPWEILKNDYPVGTICEVVIVSMTTFGAFAKIIPGIDGLIHISQIADRRIEKPQDVLKVGETVMVKVTEIDFDNKRVSLSIRALLEDEAKADEEDFETE